MPIRGAVEVHDPITILLARFEDLVGAGLRSLIGDDPNLRVPRLVEHQASTS